MSKLGKLLESISVESDKPEAKQDDADASITALINQKIKEEIDAHDSYAMSAESLKDDEKHKHTSELFSRLASEEAVHMGELQNELKLYSNIPDKIDQGQKEAEGDGRTDESKDVKKPLKEGDISDVQSDEMAEPDYRVVYWMDYKGNVHDYEFDQNDESIEEVVSSMKENSEVKALYNLETNMGLGQMFFDKETGEGMDESVAFKDFNGPEKELDEKISFKAVKDIVDKISKGVSGRGGFADIDNFDGDNAFDLMVDSDKTTYQIEKQIEKQMGKKVYMVDAQHDGDGNVLYRAIVTESKLTDTKEKLMEYLSSRGYKTVLMFNEALACPSEIADLIKKSYKDYDALAKEFSDKGFEVNKEYREGDGFNVVLCKDKKEYYLSFVPCKEGFCMEQPAVIGGEPVNEGVLGQFLAKATGLDKLLSSDKAKTSKDFIEGLGEIITKNFSTFAVTGQTDTALTLEETDVKANSPHAAEKRKIIVNYHFNAGVKVDDKDVKGSASGTESKPAEKSNDKDLVVMDSVDFYNGDTKVGGYKVPANTAFDVAVQQIVQAIGDWVGKDAEASLDSVVDKVASAAAKRAGWYAENSNGGRARLLNKNDTDVSALISFSKGDKNPKFDGVTTMVGNEEFSKDVPDGNLTADSAIDFIVDKLDAVLKHK